MSDQLPEGSKLSVIKTAGLHEGANSLYNLMGLSGGRIVLLTQLLEEYVDQHPDYVGRTSKELLAILKPVSEEI